MATTQTPRNERTVYRYTVADLDAVAGRQVTEEEIETITKGLEFSSVPDAISDLVFTVTGGAGSGEE